MMRGLVFLFLTSFVTLVYASAEGPAEVPPPVGNFSLPLSQTPGAFLSFGQNVLDKGQTQLLLYADQYGGVNNRYTDIVPGILYGLTDKLSIFFNMPIAASYQQDDQHSSGLADAFVQFEYIFYEGNTSRYFDQATVVTNMSFPTGSTSKQPATGYGAPTVFLGGTWSRTYVDWFMFTSYGATLPMSHDGTQYGNQYLYQYGLGRNIYAGHGWIFAGLVEINGQYNSKDKINGVMDPNSGGNVIYATPSLWISTKNIYIQLGAGWAVSQNLNGNQPLNKYLLAANIAYSIY